MTGPVQFSFANSLEKRPPNAVFAGEESAAAPPEIVGAVAPALALARKSALAPQRKSAPLDKPLDVLKLAKARLREVKKQLKLMAKLQIEEAELERLIAAAALPQS